MVFWTRAVPTPASWLPSLQEVVEPDGVRLLEHRIARENVSQFLVSTQPSVAPASCIRSIKGRLQYLVRDVVPKAFRRNYRICSLGEGNQAAIEQYVTVQMQHHPMADPRVEAILAPHQFVDPKLNLAIPRRSGHGEFVYNLHLVVVHQERFTEIREEYIRRTSDMLKGVALKKKHLLSRIGLVADHMHWTLGCNIDESPLEVGLSYLNNLAFAHGMRPVYQFGFYAGTFGSYDMGAVRRKL
jgi:REP element-mobilizing transposase RayT